MRKEKQRLRRAIKRVAWILLLTSSIIHAQIRTTSLHDGDQFDDARDQRRQTKEETLAFIVESTDTVTCEVDVDDRLPLFGVRHSHRNLATSDGSLEPAAAPAWIEDDYNMYSIGTTRHGMYKPSKGNKKGGKGKGKQPNTGKSSKNNDRPYPRPSARPVARPTQAPRPTPTPPTECSIQVNVDFLQFTAIPPALLVVGSNVDEQTLGTQYVYNDGLRDQDTLDELANSRASGTCTRIQSREGSDIVGLQRGRGHCQFTYSFTDSRNREIVFTVAGEVSDEFGGVLSVTGGSKSTNGAYGEIELIPVDLLPDGQFEVNTGDFFLDPLFYLADARIVVPCS